MATVPQQVRTTVLKICLANYVSEYGHELFMHLSWSGFCDFEMDFCGWVNSYPVSPQSRVDWDWLSGESEGHHVPLRDHTTKTDLGMTPLSTIFFLIKLYFHILICLLLFLFILTINKAVSTLHLTLFHRQLYIANIFFRKN